MFERFFKQQPMQLKAEEAYIFLLGKFDREKKMVESKLLGTCNDISLGFSSVEKSIADLSAKTSAQPYANRVKEKFCEKSMEAIHSLPAFSENYDSLKAFVDKSQTSVRDIGGLNMKEFRHLHAFKDEMSKIAEKMKLLESDINFAAKTANDSVMPRIDEAKNLVSDIAAKKAAMGNIDEEIADLSKSAEILREMIKNEQSTAYRLNDDFSKYAEEKIKIRDMEKSMESIRQRIDVEFAGLDRVFKKFLYYGDISKDDSSVLKDYIRSPGETFLEGDKEQRIREIAEDVHKFRDRELIGLEDDKLDRLEEIIRRFGFLIELKEKYEDSKKKRNLLEEDYKQKVEPVMQQIKTSNYEAENKMRDLGVIESALREKKSQKADTEKLVVDAKIKASFIISEILNRDVSLV